MQEMPGLRKDHLNEQMLELLIKQLLKKTGGTDQSLLFTPSKYGSVLKLRYKNLNISGNYNFSVAVAN